MKTETMTLGELIEWADNQGGREQVIGVLEGWEFVTPDGVYRFDYDDLTPVVITWPDHVTVTRPNGDILSVIEQNPEPLDA